MWRIFLATCLLSFGAGCINLDAPIDPTRYFVMNGPDASTDGVDGSIDVKLIRIEPYLATPRMVVRVGANELRFSDVNRWAEPLADNIRLVLAGHLSTLSSGKVHPRLAVNVDIHQFEGNVPDQAVLAATWSIEDMSGTIRAGRRSEHTLSGWGGTDYQQLAGLLESTLALLAEEIAAEL